MKMQDKPLAQMSVAEELEWLTELRQKVSEGKAGDAVQTIDIAIRAVRRVDMPSTVDYDNLPF